MGSVNFGNAYPETPLLRHGSSIFSLTVEEVQNVLGEQAGNLGSMNMDEFFKNIWTLEESQAMASAMNPIEGLNRGLSTQFSLQNQGSLCLPRTLSTKAAEDLWKTILAQQGTTEAASNAINHHQRQISLEDFLVKAEAVKERPPHGEVTLEDFLVKAGIVREGPPLNPVPSNQVLMASDNPVSIDQTQQVRTSQNMVPSSQAHQVPVRPFLAPSNQQHNGSVIQTLTPSNQVQQQVPPFPGHQRANSTQSTLTPSNLLPPLPAHQQATPILSSPVPERAPGHCAFMGFGGFPISRNDGGLENKNGQAAPNAMNSFVPTAASALSCPPPSGKTQFDALNSMFLPGQQSDWINNSCGKSITHQNQLVQRQAEAPSALGSVANATNGPSLESSPGRLSPLGGGFGAALGTGGLGMSRGGNAYPSTRISFGPCSPLSPEFDEGSPETSNLPLSMISEFGNRQLQRKKRSADPPVERVIERRQRRMIKNRESAARSRARKQAYTVELEAEVSQLKEENMELLRKQEEEAALRKKQILALMPSTPEIACKGRYLKRSHTGPW